MFHVSENDASLFRYRHKGLDQEDKREWHAFRQGIASFLSINQSINRGFI